MSENVSVVMFEQEKHYAMICSWWEAHKWPCLPLESFPKTGILISVNDEFVCAVWLYTSDSNICWMEWMISNPHSPKKYREIALPFLIETCLKIAKSQGFKIVFTSIKHNRLLKRLLSAGFIINDIDTTTLTYII